MPKSYILIQDDDESCSDISSECEWHARVPSAPLSMSSDSSATSSQASHIEYGRCGPESQDLVTLEKVERVRNYLFTRVG